MNLNNKKLKRALQGRTPTSVIAAFEALEKINIIEFITKGKKSYLHLNGKSRPFYYNEIAQNHERYWKEYGPFNPNEMTVQKTVEKIMDVMGFTFRTFTKFNPEVTISDIHLKTQEELKEPNPERPLIDLRKKIRNKIMFLTEPQLNEVLEYIQKEGE